jgi:hypothetical protein
MRLLCLTMGVAAIGWLANLGGFVSEAHAQSPPELSILSPAPDGWTRLRLAGSTNEIWNIWKIDASEDLVEWKPIAVLHASRFVWFWTDPFILNYEDPAAPDHRRRFYRASVGGGEDSEWKNQVYFPADFYVAGGQFGEAGLRWIKFAILTDDPFRVYYQDSDSYLFHYDFATVHLDPLKGIGREEFDRVALHVDGQEVVLGALLFPPLSLLAPNSGRATVPEFGIQFVGLDPYPSEQIARWFRLVSSTVAAPPDTRGIYMPVFEQMLAARLDREFLLACGIEVDTPNRWLSGDVCYAEGWVLGKLKYFPPDQIEAAYADGRLTPDDILVTDAVPAEMPLVAGIISLEPSTPNSHVSIMARSYVIPFVYLARREDRERVLGQVGGEFLLQAASESGRSTVWAFAVDPHLDDALRGELLELRTVPPVNFPAKAHFGGLAISADALTPADIQFFGGKAAHFGLLRRAIPSNAPPAIAFSFDLWDEFMDQVVGGGMTLRDEIQERLSRHSYPPEMVAFRADLAAIRQMITKTASFNAVQRQAIIDALSGFDADRNIRFRSSSNVEDGETFTGAGLYDSFSGCLRDDLDGDSVGPCRCDPEEDGERGVFRAIQKVYASFYNNNAVLERLRRGVTEEQAGMALLVHHSYPDELEMANGVATCLTTERWRTAEMVTQAGAVSVTNPDSSAQPEVMDEGLVIRQGSSLVPLGATVMSMPGDYVELRDLLFDAASAYHAFYPAKTNSLLDFEYKKIQPGRLEVKQLRPLPLPDAENEVTPFLLSDPVEYWVPQGETESVFRFHQPKLRLTLATRNMRLNQTNLVDGFYNHGRLEYLEEAEIRTMEGSFFSWPEATQTMHPIANGWILTNRWSVGEGLDCRAYELETYVTYSPTTARSPVRTLNDLTSYGLSLRIEFAEPQLAIDGVGNLTSFTNARLSLRPRPAATGIGLRQERGFSVGPVQIRTVFYWWEPGEGFSIKTFELERWEETSITGLTAEPIVLRSYYSQTYGPGHHNFSEEFVFEPRLEPGLAVDQLTELEAANIRLVYVAGSPLDDRWRVFILGSDGQVREVR